jgi:ERCC4-related helicase
MPLIDNQEENVASFLHKHLKEGSALRLVSAYFTIHAYAGLRHALEQLKYVRFLFGEPRFIQKINSKDIDFHPFEIRGERIKPSNALKQSAIACACQAWIQKGNVEIKSVKQAGLLHGKMYHITDPQDHEHAIIGSSNFTEAGLGLSKNSNIELNMTVEDNRDRRDLKQWFDRQWNDDDLVEDVKDKVLYYLQQMYKKVSPETLYFKTLFHLFERHLEANQDIQDDEKKSKLHNSIIWQELYEFQKQGVRLALSKLNQYNGCIIADSVGLGKTYEALAVIKAFENKNKSVLVLCPKKLERNWNQFIEKRDTNPLLKDRFSYTVKAHSIFLTQEESHFAWEHFDLIVIDESHHFRNESASRFQKLLDIMKDSKPKVLLLSATPVNNNLSDLKNQLRLIASDKDDHFNDEALGIHDFKRLLDSAQKAYKSWCDSKGTEQHHLEIGLQERLPMDYFKLCDEMIIARSRKHIEEFYKADLEKLGTFPKRLKNVSYNEYELKIGDPLSYEQLAECFEKLTLASYKIRDFIRSECLDDYKKAENNQLIGLLKIGLFKRLESSVVSFALTLERMIERIEKIEQKLKSAVFNLTDETFSSIDETLDESEDDTLLDAIETEKRNFKNVPLSHIDLDAWRLKLEDDKAILKTMLGLVEGAKGKSDGKLQLLKQHIAEKVTQANRKVLVFTQYSDTASYLYDELSQSLPHYSMGLVTGGETKAKCGAVNFESILGNFSPRSKKTPEDKTQEIDILIATDCISEGQNLQDCDQIINYDIHWNPVRLIQRFGRIDRLNSQNKAIQMVNFWSAKDLEEYLKLEIRISGKATLANITTSGNDNVLNDEDIEYNYRKKQFEIIEDETHELEEAMEDDLDVASHSFNDFITELLQFLSSQKEELKKLPFGLNSVVSSLSDELTPSGVIFCLKHVVETSRNRSINAFNPYYLIYVTADGVQGTSIKNRADAFKVLDLYRRLCRDKTSPHKELVQWCDHKIADDNDPYFDKLLKQAIQSLSEKYKARLEKTIDDFELELPQFQENEQVTDESSLELVTWLVIQ